MKYTYKIAKENIVNGSRPGETRVYHSEKPLEVGALYFYLPGLKGGYRVLQGIEKGAKA